jgi:integrase
MKYLIGVLTFATLALSTWFGKNVEGESAECTVSNGAIWNLDTRLVPNREEMTRILAIAKERSARTYIFLAICSHMGFRLCETGHIKSSDLLNGKVRVTRRKKKHLQPSTVDVPDSLWPLLKEWGESYDGYIFPGNAAPCVIHRSKKGVRLPDEPVCEGGHLSLRVIQRDFGLIVAEAGLRMRGRGVHQTRHYFATELYAATRDLRATQVALDHASIDMTTRYAHAVEQREKINLVKAVL